MKYKTILVTGAAGFIGSNLIKRLLEFDEGSTILAIDNLNDYYDPKLKIKRLDNLGIKVEKNKIISGSTKFEKLFFIKYDLINNNLSELLNKYNNIEIVVHLAAQAGVRYSIVNPRAYIDSNLLAFFNVLNTSRDLGIKNFIYASSSSVYGDTDKYPFLEEDDITKPSSLYAATKVANELIARTYSHAYGMRTLGLRLFSVYGPWGRPDMAYYKFTDAIFRGDEIEVYNRGDLYRDFTYIDDITNCIISLMKMLIQKVDSGQRELFEVVNIGNSKPIKISDFIEILSNSIGKTVNIDYKEKQLGDVYKTYANNDKLKEMIGFIPNISIEEGLSRFVNWYREYHKV